MGADGRGAPRDAARRAPDRGPAGRGHRGGDRARTIRSDGRGPCGSGLTLTSPRAWSPSDPLSAADNRLISGRISGQTISTSDQQIAVLLSCAGMNDAGRPFGPDADRVGAGDPPHGSQRSGGGAPGGATSPTTRSTTSGMKT